jgi:cysteine desulfurase / selenocysteine lyase
VTAADVCGEALAPKGDFPETREMVYLNQAAIGLVPTPVAEVMQSFTAELGRRGTALLDEEAEARVLDVTRRAAATLMGADTTRIAIVSSASEALNQFVWWLRPGARQNVVLLDGDFPSVTLPWLRVAEESGVEIRFVATRDDPALANAVAIRDHVDERTAAICVGHVQYAGGHRIDLAALREAAEPTGAFLVVDATQSLGAVGVDVTETPVDLLVASSHKWLCAPHGAALCYLGPRLDGFRPPFVGWRGAADAAAFDGRTLRLASDARRAEVGTIAYGAAHALAAGIDYLERLGRTRIEAHLLSLTKRLAYGLCHLDARILTPALARQRAGIVSARFPDHEAEALVERLKSHRVFVSARQDAVRFAVHVFNDIGDIDGALAAVHEETQRIRRVTR